MHMNTKRWILLTLLAGLAALQVGCVVLAVGGAAAAGAGTYAYFKGEMKVDEPVSLDRGWTATLAAMKELRYVVRSQNKGALEAELEARTEGDVKVHITLKRLTDNATEFRLRVGTFGDEVMSKMIMERIRKHY